jgi:hypothetical protein
MSNVLKRCFQFGAVITAIGLIGDTVDQILNGASYWQWAWDAGQVCLIVFLFRLGFSRNPAVQASDKRPV